MKSLIAFADSLGYEYYGSWYGFDNGDKFIERDFEGFKTCVIISINTMVRLHNADWVLSKRDCMVFPSDGGYHTRKLGQELKLDSVSPFHIDFYTHAKAQASKIVKTVYLNGGKNGISCYRQQLEFVSPYYYDMFLVPLIKAQQAKEGENV
jgi:hypothetical protein